MTSNQSRYQRIARCYDLLDLPFEWGRYRLLRPQLFRSLTGRLLDAGVGTGRNFPYYPPDTSVVGVDNSPAMLTRAEHRRPQSLVPVELREMDVTRLDFPDNSFDAAVATFLFCVLPEGQQTIALRELGRVVRPGGCIRLLEYVRPRGTFRRVFADLWAPWMAWAYGAGFDRRTEEHIPEAGLEIIDERYVANDLIKQFNVHVPDQSALDDPFCAGRRVV